MLWKYKGVYRSNYYKITAMLDQNGLTEFSLEYRKPRVPWTVYNKPQDLGIFSTFDSAAECAKNHAEECADSWEKTNG